MEEKGGMAIAITTKWFMFNKKVTELFQFQFQFSCSVVSDSLQPREPQHARPPCPLPAARVYPNSCPLSWWCQPTISSSVVPFSSCPQSFPESGSFQMSQLFASGGQSMYQILDSAIFIYVISFNHHNNPSIANIIVTILQRRKPRFREEWLVQDDVTSDRDNRNGSDSKSHVLDE